jgi:hypothetical protein
MTGDWRDWRPAIWLAMLGVAAMLVVSPFWYGAVFLGAAIGAGIRIQQRRRRLEAGAKGSIARSTGGQTKRVPGNDGRKGRRR